MVCSVRRPQDGPNVAGRLARRSVGYVVRSKSLAGGISVGDEAGGLVEAYDQHRDALKSYLIRRLQCPDTAEDLTQETWLKANRSGSVPAAISNPRAYLFTMAANLATDYLRTETRRSELRGEYRGALCDSVDPLTPEQYLIAQDELKHLRKAVARLRPISRKIFYLSRFSGRSYTDIAAELGVSTTTVANHIRLVLDHLAEAREDYAGE